MESWNLPKGWIARPATAADAEIICNLFNANSRHLSGEDKHSLHEIEGMLTSPRIDKQNNARLIVDASGLGMGWCHTLTLGEPHARISCAITLHPEIHSNADLWDQLYYWALERAHSFIPMAEDGIRVTCSTRANVKNADRLAAIGRAGFHQVRVENHMRVELGAKPCAPQWPDGIGVRIARIEQELSAIVEVELESFRDHWGFVETPLEEEIKMWQDTIRIAGEAFNPDIWYLAVEEEQIVGFAICEDHMADDKARGYVQALGVRPAWRRRGIAKALLLHAFRGLHDLGCKTVELDMDSENLTGALRLYEGVGMKAVQQSILHEKEIRPGKDLVHR